MVEDFFFSGYDHAGSTVSGAICRGTISVDLEVTMTYFLDGSLSPFELEDLRHRFARWCHVDGGWGWLVLYLVFSGVRCASFKTNSPGVVLRRPGMALAAFSWALSSFPRLEFDNQGAQACEPYLAKDL